jgi:hypothetical protein
MRGEASRDDLPDGLIFRIRVKPIQQKYFAFSEARSGVWICHPASIEGRIAIVTDVGSGMRWTRQRAQTKRAGADGQVVWS